MRHLITQDMNNGNGVIVLSPKNDLFQSLLSSIGDDRASALIYFDPTDSKPPIIGFNPFILETGEDLYHSHFTNLCSLPSPYVLSLENLWICSIVSRCDSFEGKGHKMPHMEIKIVPQAPRRPRGLAIPRAHRLRRADCCDGFQQRPNYQGQTDRRR